MTCLANIKYVPEECEIVEEVGCRRISTNAPLWAAGTKNLPYNHISQVSRVVRLHNGKVKPVYFARGWERVKRCDDFDTAMTYVFQAFPTAVAIYRDVEAKLPSDSAPPDLCFGFFIRKSLDHYQIWRKPSNCCYEHFVQEVTILGQHVWGIEGVMFGQFVQHKKSPKMQALLYGLTATLDHPPDCPQKDVYLTIDFTAQQNAFVIQGLWWADGDKIDKHVPMTEENHNIFHEGSEPELNPLRLISCLCPKSRLELN